MIKIRDLVTNQFIYEGQDNVNIICRAIRKNATPINEGFKTHYMLEIFINKKTIGEKDILSRNLEEKIQIILDTDWFYGKSTMPNVQGSVHRGSESREHGQVPEMRDNVRSDSITGGAK